MQDFRLPKDRFTEFAQALAQGREAFAPSYRPGRSLFARLEDLSQLSLAGPNPDMPVKGLIFPASQSLLRYCNPPGPEAGILKAEPEAAQQAVVFGVRPCDAASFELFDEIFLKLSAAPDPYYARGRENTLLVGLGCNEPCASCFCAQMGLGPQHTAWLDILLLDLGADYLARAVSPKGIEACQGLEPASKEGLAKANELERSARARMDYELKLAPLLKAELMQLYTLPLWQELAERCLNCGACTYVCPTCHCFDLQDETVGKQGRRVRNWDSCMAWLFTQHASGHNPRATKMHRVRQRFMHKLKYIPLRQNGAWGCVGCGRCVRLCPVNIDIREVIQSLAAPLAEAVC